jgi:hypothetical protein
VSARRAALRVLVTDDRHTAAVAVLEVLDRAPGDPLCGDALRAFASVATEVAALRHDAPRFLLGLLTGVSDAETALACGAALDALPLGSIRGDDLAAAVERTSLPEARVALLRTLATVDAGAAGAVLERAVKDDGSPLVRAEALSLLAARRQPDEVLRVRDSLVRDAALRAAAPRALASVPGAAIDQLLVEAFIIEQDASVQKRLAQTISQRAVAWPTVAMSESQVRALRAAQTTQRRQP